MKLDNSSMKSNSQTLSSDYSKAETALYDVYKALTVLINSNNFRGDGATAYKDFMQSASLNYAYELLDISKQVKKFAKNAYKGFLEFESEESGVVTSDTVDNDKESLNTISSKLSTMISDLSATNKSASAEGVAITKTGASKLTTIISDIIKDLETVNEDFKMTDDSLKTGAETIQTSIDNLNTNLSNISSGYISSSGKYYLNKMKGITDEKWYVKGPSQAFDKMQENDAYSYSTGYYALSETQFITGNATDVYALGNASFISGASVYSLDNGQRSLMASGEVISTDFDIRGSNITRLQGEGKVVYGEFDGSIGLTNGLYLSMGVGVAKATGKASLFDEHLGITANAEALTAEAEVALYSDENKTQVGFSGEATVASASVDFGVDFFGVSNSYTVSETGEKESKHLLSAHLKPKGTGGAFVIAMYTDEKIYDSFLGQDWIDVHTTTIELGASFGLGGSLSITVPSLALDLF